MSGFNRFVPLVLGTILTLGYFSSLMSQDWGYADSIYFDTGNFRRLECSEMFELTVPVMVYSDASPGPLQIRIVFNWQGDVSCDTIVFTNNFGADSVAVSGAIDNVAKQAVANFVCWEPQLQFNFGWPAQTKKLCEIKFRGTLNDSMSITCTPNTFVMHSWTHTWTPSYVFCEVSSHFPDSVISIPGDPDCSGIVTISDVVFLISYVFSGGSPPHDLNAADADGSCQVTISDAVYLINYIFAGGPPPQAGCVG